MVLDISPFDLKDTFECGQCFRWNENPDKSYTGVAFVKFLNVKKEENNIILSDDLPIWHDYFDIHTDYNIIMKELS